MSEQTMERIVDTVLGMISLAGGGTFVKLASPHKQTLLNEIKKWRQAKQTRKQLLEAARQAESDFKATYVQEYEDTTLAQAVASYPLADNEIFQSALRRLTENLDEPFLSEYLERKIAEDWPGEFGQEQIHEGIVLYLECLRKRLLMVDDYREIVTGLATLRIDRRTEENNQILRKLHAQVRREQEESNAYEENYKRAIVQCLDQVEAIGIPVLEKARRQQHLTDLYIPLHVKANLDERLQNTRGARPIGNVIAPRLRAQTLTDETVALGEETSERGPQPFSGLLEELLTRTDRFVLRGEAGSGKSTFLQWIAVRAAREDFPEHLEAWDETIPLFIRLRECSEDGFPTIEDIPSLLTRMVGGKPDQWVHQQLVTGRAVVMIDGIDELPEAQRDDMFRHLQQLVAAYPLARYLITSRPPAIKEERWPAWNQWAKEEGFVEAILQPLSIEQLNTFIDQWHQALLKTITNTSERTKVKKLSVQLQDLLKRRKALRKLATNPLLGAMICALHRDRGSNLPSKRNRLYQESVEMLLTRDLGREVPMDDYPLLNLEEGVVLAQRLAAWMMENSYTRVEVDQADRYLDQQLPFINRDDVSGQGVSRFFDERANLLRQPITGRFEFTHRTFQEYLAAKQFAEEGSLGILMEHSHEDSWREIIILACGEVRPKEREQLLSSLLSRGEEASEQEAQRHYYLLAMACLETSILLDPAIREKVIRRATPLFPPQDEEEVKQLALAGNPAVDLLTPKENHQPKEAALCVQTLAQIGTKDALDTLVTYAQRYQKLDYEMDRYVQLALGQAWKSFDREIYARTVISKTKVVRPCDVLTEEDIRWLPHIEALDLSSTSVRDLGPLANLAMLQWLDLCDTSVNNLSPLASLGKLQKLHLSRTSVHDLSPLGNLKMLKDLYLDDTTFSDLSSLANLKELCRLLLHGTCVNNFSLLRELKELRWLGLNRTSFHDLSLLTNLKELKGLYLYETGVSDLSPLVELKNIKALNLGGTSVSNLNVVAGLTRIQGLVLRETTVNVLDSLAGLTDLQGLDLSETRVRDLEPLADLAELQYLYLGGTDVSDLHSLADLRKLRVVVLSGTKVSNLSPLADMNELQELYLDGTNVIDLSPLAELHKLQVLYLIDTSVSDLSPVEDITGLEIVR